VNSILSYCVDDVRPENLGFYACQLDIKESKFDYTIHKLCSGLLDTSNQNGRPEKIITGNRKIANPSTYVHILQKYVSLDSPSFVYLDSYFSAF
jgi:hypothetical protein